jgi:hypothetical protein
MNSLTEGRLESTPLVRSTRSLPSSAARTNDRSKGSPMYSPLSLAFFGLTGTAVGTAGVTGSFGGLTSLMVTAGALLALFVLFLLARATARRNASR